MYLLFVSCGCVRLSELMAFRIWTWKEYWLTLLQKSFSHYDLGTQERTNVKRKHVNSSARFHKMCYRKISVV